jgi:hypothetical protein
VEPLQKDWKMESDWSGQEGLFVIVSCKKYLRNFEDLLPSWQSKFLNIGKIVKISEVKLR